MALSSYRLTRYLFISPVLSQYRIRNFSTKPPKYSEGPPPDSVLKPRYLSESSLIRAPYETDLSKVDVAMVGVPFDLALTHRPGTRFGPKELRVQSGNQLRAINQFTNVCPHSTALRVRDVGDVPIDTPFDIIGAHKCIEEFYTKLNLLGIIPISAGGDHSVSLPILRALGKNGPVGMVHIDAHADTGEAYQGFKFSHGSPFKIAVEDGVLDPKRTIQIGIRGTVSRTDYWQFSYDSGMRVMMMEEFYKMVHSSAGIQSVVDEIFRVCGKDQPTYLSFDIDAIDSTFAPGTGTPEIGGILPIEAQMLVRELTDLNLIGGDLVEVSPPYDPSGNTALLGAQLLFEISCVIVESLIKRKSLS
ncbi:Agmatinase [Oopsacas minuta]|uniref:Agmatinase n=1 Tax=Oopsacas minuta TaxID=111878 RepID=A0AAV7K8L4_9METZ|nr:Agmatinase [Oopsacas minuta]